MRTLGHFEIQPDMDDRGESTQPEADQKRKLEPISENRVEGNTERDSADAHPLKYPLKQKLSPLKEMEGSSFEGEPDRADSEPRLAPGFSEALNDPNLFSSRNAKDYSYEEGKLGKCASGVLGKVDVPVRDPIAQREVGGDERRDTDDGGHLIGARFGAAPGEKNLDAQDRNLNRGSYKKWRMNGQMHWTTATRFTPMLRHIRILEPNVRTRTWGGR